MTDNIKITMAHPEKINKRVTNLVGKFEQLASKPEQLLSEHEAVIKRSSSVAVMERPAWAAVREHSPSKTVAETEGSHVRNDIPIRSRLHQVEKSLSRQALAPPDEMVLVPTPPSGAGPQDRETTDNVFASNQKPACEEELSRQHDSEQQLKSMETEIEHLRLQLSSNNEASKTAQDRAEIEIETLRHQLSQIESSRQNDLEKATGEIEGRLGAEIEDLHQQVSQSESLRQNELEKATDDLQDRLGAEIEKLRQQLTKSESEHQTEQENAEVEIQVRDVEIKELSQQLSLRESSHQTDLEKKELEVQTRLNSEIKDLHDQLIQSESLHIADLKQATLADQDHLANADHLGTKIDQLKHQLSLSESACRLLERANTELQKRLDTEIADLHRQLLHSEDLLQRALEKAKLETSKFGILDQAEPEETDLESPPQTDLGQSDAEDSDDTDNENEDLPKPILRHQPSLRKSSYQIDTRDHQILDLTTRLQAAETATLLASQHATATEKQLRELKTELSTSTRRTESRCAMTDRELREEVEMLFCEIQNWIVGTFRRVRIGEFSLFLTFTKRQNQSEKTNVKKKRLTRITPKQIQAS